MNRYRNVVGDDRQGGVSGNVAEVIEDVALVDLRVERCGGDGVICSTIRGARNLFDYACRGGVNCPDEDRHTPISTCDDGLNNGIPLDISQERHLAGRSEGEEPVDSAVDLKVDEPF